MRWLLLLLTAYGAGIVVADRGGALGSVERLDARLATGEGLELVVGLASTVAVADVIAVVVAVAVAAVVVAAVVLVIAGGIRARCVAAVLVVVAFAAGHQGLARELDRARRGAALARSSSQRPSGDFHLVDARVVARRPTGFGEEVELRDLRGRAGEGPVPERLLVAWTPSTSADRRRAKAVGPDVAADSEPSTRADRLLWPGARVRLALRIAPLRPPRNPGTPDREHALARRGIGARGRLVKPDWVVETVADSDLPGRLEAWIASQRRESMKRTQARLPGDRPGAALVRALALGDRQDLAEPTRRAFRELGLAHLLSVSGLHIGFVALPAAAVVGRLRVLGRPRGRPVLGFGLPITAGCVVALCYAGWTGGSVPALRASLSFLVFGAARQSGRIVAPGPALAGVALALLVSDPATLFDPGARFSFTACAALVGARLWGAAPKDATIGAGRAGSEARESVTRARRLFEALVDPLRASLAVSFGLLPWVELEGLPRALPSPLINALAIPWAGLVVLPCSLAASGLALALPVGWGEPVLDALLWPAVALEQGAGWLASALGPAWTGADREGRLPWSLGLGLIGLGFIALRRRALVGAGVLWLVLGSLGLAPIRETGFARERPRIVFFDVGQADAALVETREAAWLIDSGPGSEDGSGGGTVLRALRALGVERLDGLVITHGDLDHRGGALRLLSALEVGELWLPALPHADPELTQLAADATRRGVRVVRVAAGTRRRVGGSLVLEVLWPPSPSSPSPQSGSRGPGEPGERGRGPFGDDPGRKKRTRNEESIVLRAAIDGRSVLFAADVGSVVEERLRVGGERLSAELLKVGHHGSRGSSSPEFLAAVAAEVALVSAPCDATRGLPSPIALERLRASGSRLAWTGRDGAVAIGWDAAGARWMQSWGRTRDCPGDAPASAPP